MLHRNNQINLLSTKWTLSIHHPDNTERHTTCFSTKSCKFNHIQAYQQVQHTLLARRLDASLPCPTLPVTLPAITWFIYNQSHARASADSSGLLYVLLPMHIMLAPPQVQTMGNHKTPTPNMAPSSAQHLLARTDSAVRHALLSSFKSS